jgi:dipeptidyl aminopeptidase/acylaminoacyl peptidase
MNRNLLAFSLSLVFHLLLWAPGDSLAQSTSTFEPEAAQRFEFPLTIRSIMRGQELVGSSPERIQWSDDSRWIYFQWLPGGASWHEDPELFRVFADGGEPEKVPVEAADSLAILFADGALSPDGAFRISSVDGDLYLVDRSRMGVTRLTDTGEMEESPSFRRDGEAVFFSRNGNLFELELDGGRLRQLTDIRSGSTPPGPSEASGQRAFLEEQQEELFRHIRVEKEAKAKRDSARERAQEEEPKPFLIPEGEALRQLSPNAYGSFVVLSLYEPPEGARQTMVPEWVTESGYTEELNVRTKVGDAEGSSRIALLDTATGEVVWLDLFPTEDEPSEENAEGVAAEEGTRAENSNPDLSDATFMGWNDVGTHALLMSVNYDFDTRWFFTVEAATGELTLLDAYFDEAWAEGACFRCAGWLPDSDVVYFTSEETGYAHLYSVRADGTGRKALTRGEWEVLDVQLHPDKEGFILQTNEGSPFNQHVFTMRLDGSRRRALTSGPGSYDVTPSPDGRRMAVVHSQANRPPELFVGDLKAEIRLDQVTYSPTEEWLTFPWIRPEIIHFQASDGVRVPARIYRPADLGAEGNGAAVIFVHGAGYRQNVHNFWSSYYREYMFHHLLAATGYTVLDIDYRGSAGYGRDWRAAIYRWMGGRDLDDQVDGAAYLVSAEGIDPHRIGIYGGSYGGFTTLMALFTKPEVFAAGAALRSVTDWPHYNHWYSGRILNPPQEDPEAHRRSSPIYFAEGLQGHLLIAHGMVDTNVHFSDVVRLAQRLIELGKENWEMAVYPVEDHGFEEPSSWTDEYRRIFELFERTIGKG